MHDQKKITIPKIEFYITNVCNLTCSNCNRFNDYNFKGWQAWSDYEEIYTKWAQKIDIGHIVILGGEPLLNPSICDWISGINRVMNQEVQVLTNGTRLNHVPGLYEAIHNCPIPGKTNWIGISIHNASELDWYIDQVKKFMRGTVKSHKENNIGADYFFIDENNVKVALWMQDKFVSAAVHTLPNGKLGLYNNDPEAAHSICSFAQWKCYHFIRGKLYKCGPVALFPEFDRQFDLELSATDRQLINSYRPLEVDEFDSRGTQFLSDLDNPIPQCKFCPASIDLKQQKIQAVRKGHHVKNSSHIG